MDTLDFIYIDDKKYYIGYACTACGQILPYKGCIHNCHSFDNNEQMDEGFEEENEFMSEIKTVISYLMHTHQIIIQEDKALADDFDDFNDNNDDMDLVDVPVNIIDNAWYIPI